jgi:hypothetical protein
MPAKFISLVGHQFGFLIVTEHLGFNKSRQSMYRTKCLCGTERVVRGSGLTSFAVRRCGKDCKYERPKIIAEVRTIARGLGDETHFAK